MATEIDVANSALALLKAPRLTSLLDNVETASLLRLRLPLCRDAVLELAPWHFASVRVRLAQSALTPAFDWAYQYPLPTQPWCLKVRDPDPVRTPWEVGYDVHDGRVLFSNTATMQIRYTARVLDLSIWSPLAVQALCYMLAAELALALTGDAKKAQLLQQSYVTLLGEAITSDAGEGSPVVAWAPDTLTWIR